jgi:formate-dependent phosphoribosylglycinamide formyltransferase (GAR transformylase)
MVATSTLKFEQLQSWDKKGFNESNQGKKPAGAGQDAGQGQAGAQALLVIVEGFIDLDMRLEMFDLGGLDQRQTFVEAVPEFRNG